MKTVSAILLASVMLASLTASAAIVFNDQFTTDGDLSKWTVTQGSPTVSGGVLQMAQPTTEMKTTSTWTGAGKYTLEFNATPFLQWSDGSTYMSVSMPGGISINFRDYNNGVIFYNPNAGQWIDNNDNIRSVSEYLATPTAYKVELDGRSFKVSVNGNLELSTTLTTDCDFNTYNSIGLAFHNTRGDYAAGSYNYVTLDYTPVPEPAALGLLLMGLAGLAGRRRR